MSSLVPDAFEIFGVRLDHYKPDELHERLSWWLMMEGQRRIVTPNAEMVLLARKDDAFRDVLRASDMALPDTVSLAYAVAAFSSERLEYTHPGVDTLHRIASLCAEQESSLILLGGQGSVAVEAAKRLRHLYPGLMVRGINPGDISFDEEGCGVNLTVLQQIASLRPTAIAVALGQKKQEFFMERYLSWFPTAKVAIGVGGALDMISETIPRAPLWVQERGFEWVWRLYKEPKRIGRIARASLVFPAHVAYHCYKRGNFIRACKRVFPEIVKRVSGRKLEM
jgi:N-acetylglucosaminyldiphosphoundecaprenol N-acetyl-beta-D-mannosaminyltransferase